MSQLRSIGIAVLALSMGLGGVASAQDHGGRDHGDRHSGHRGSSDHNDRNNRSHGSDRHDSRDVRAANFPRGNPGYNGRGEARDHRGEWRGAGPSHDFRRGGRLPPQYRGRGYVVDDWRGHHLNSPPRGYHWVQTGGDYVLAAVATGVILQILLNN